MVDINDIYKSNSEYMKAEDIGNDMWTFTIKTADVKEFQDGDRKLVLSFNEWEKSLPLNATNARAVADLYGHNSNAWIGQQIMLFSMPVKFQDRMVNAIRIRAPMRQGQPPQPAPAQASHQRPLAQGYADASGGTMSYTDRSPPPPSEADMRF